VLCHAILSHLATSVCSLSLARTSCEVVLVGAGLPAHAGVSAPQSGTHCLPATHEPLACTCLLHVPMQAPTPAPATQGNDLIGFDDLAESATPAAAAAPGQPFVLYCVVVFL